MENLEQQIHLRNIVSCLSEIKDYTHYLSYERYASDKELKNAIYRNISLAASEAVLLQRQGKKLAGLNCLTSLHDLRAFEEEQYSLYNLLINDVDFLSESFTAECERLQKESSTLSQMAVA